jgi:hypothetical protein
MEVSFGSFLKSQSVIGQIWGKGKFESFGHILWNSRSLDFLESLWNRLIESSESIVKWPYRFMGAPFTSMRDSPI